MAFSTATHQTQNKDYLAVQMCHSCKLLEKKAFQGLLISPSRSIKWLMVSLYNLWCTRLLLIHYVRA